MLTQRVLLGAQRSSFRSLVSTNFLVLRHPAPLCMYTHTYLLCACACAYVRVPVYVYMCVLYTCVCVCVCVCAWVCWCGCVCACAWGVCTCVNICVLFLLVYSYFVVLPRNLPIWSRPLTINHRYFSTTPTPPPSPPTTQNETTQITPTHNESTQSGPTQPAPTQSVPKQGEGMWLLIYNLLVHTPPPKNKVFGYWNFIWKFPFWVWRRQAHLRREIWTLNFVSFISWKMQENLIKIGEAATCITLSHIWPKTPQNLVGSKPSDIYRFKTDRFDQINQIINTEMGFHFIKYSRVEEDSTLWYNWWSRHGFFFLDFTKICWKLACARHAPLWGASTCEATAFSPRDFSL